MVKLKDIAKTLGISDVSVHYIVTGKRQISWPIAERLSGLFPGKNTSQWKRATPSEFLSAFEQLKIEGVA